MKLIRVTHRDAPVSDNLFQSGFWADFKTSLGQEALCFILEHEGRRVPLVALLRKGPGHVRYAYVPRGPCLQLEESQRGPFLEALSEALAAYLPADVACVRYDTIFPSPFTAAEYWTVSGQWKGAPRPAIRELRMNYGTARRNLRKAAIDHLCPDTVIIDLRGTEDEILARMRRTTRNCVRRAFKSGVLYRRHDKGWLPEWYAVYSETARRKGFYCEAKSYFELLLDQTPKSGALREPKGGSSGAPTFILLSAEKNKTVLACAILGVMGKKGYYMYAGSNLIMRETMPNYGLQMEAIRTLRTMGCTEYDLMGIPPNGDPQHSMYGLYTFKTGLGGKIAHYSGCWDYPFDAERYETMRNAENFLTRSSASREASS